MSDFYGRRFLGIELALSVALAVSFAAFILWSPERDAVLDVVKGSRGALYTTLTSLFGSLLGFVIAAVSIVLGYADDKHLSRIRSQPKLWAQLWSIFTSANKWLAFATLISLVALIFDRDSSPRHELLCLVVLFGLIASTRIARCVWILNRIVHVVAAGASNQTDTSYIDTHPLTPKS